MIRHLIIGGCSFSVDSVDNWPYHLLRHLRRKNIHLTTQNISYPSQGQDRIQKKLTKCISAAVNTYKPEHILVCVMWSGTARRCWYIDNPLFINEIIDKSVKSKGSTYLDQLSTLDNNYDMQKRITVMNTDGHKFHTGTQGGWIHTKSAGQVPLDFLQSEFCLNPTVPGESIVHASLENIIGLQNFCRSKGIKVVHQFYMDNVYNDFLMYKDHQIIKYLFKQLDKDYCITQGMFEYLKERAGISPKMSFSDMQSTPAGREYFIDGFHSSSKGAQVWVDDVLFPFLQSKGLVV